MKLKKTKIVEIDILDKEHCNRCCKYFWYEYFGSNIKFECILYYKNIYSDNEENYVRCLDCRSDFS